MNRHRPALRTSALALAIAVASVLAFGCGDSGGEPIDEENILDAGVRATEVVVRAVRAHELVPLLAIHRNPPVGARAVSAGSADPITPLGVCESGSGSVQGELAGEMLFSACAWGPCTFDGRAAFEIVGPMGAERIEWATDLLGVDCGGMPPSLFDQDVLDCEIETLDTFTASCAVDLARFDGHLTGRSYGGAGVDVTGAMVTYVNLIAMLDDPVLGEIAVSEASPLTFDDCAGGVPAGGGLLVEGKGESWATFAYLGCSTVNVCVTLDAESGTSCTQYPWGDLVPALD